jgi:hypothetical protein
MYAKLSVQELAEEQTKKPVHFRECEEIPRHIDLAEKLRFEAFGARATFL